LIGDSNTCGNSFYSLNEFYYVHLGPGAGAVPPGGVACGCCFGLATGSEPSPRLTAARWTAHRSTSGL